MRGQLRPTLRRRAGPAAGGLLLVLFQTAGPFGPANAAPNSSAHSRLASSRAGILAVAAPPQWARRLNVGLGRAVAERGVQGIMGPIELRSRLLEASGIDTALAEARDQVIRCETASVAMQRDAARRWALRALITLRAIGDHYVAPQLTARAHVAHGLAALLHPADTDEALRAFGAAVDADPTYRPDGDLPPRAAKLLARARQGWRRPTAPDTETLRRLSALSGLTRLVWVALDPRGQQQVAIRVRLYSLPRLDNPQRMRRNTPERDALATIANLVSFLLQRQLAATLAAPIAVGNPGQSEGHAPTVSHQKRWYERWWVWTIVGAVVLSAGVGTAIAVAAKESPSPPKGFDVTFDLPP